MTAWKLGQAVEHPAVDSPGETERRVKTSRQRMQEGEDTSFPPPLSLRKSMKPLQATTPPTASRRRRSHAACLRRVLSPWLAAQVLVALLGKGCARGHSIAGVRGRERERELQCECECECECVRVRA